MSSCKRARTSCGVVGCECSCGKCLAAIESQGSDLCLEGGNRRRGGGQFGNPEPDQQGRGVGVGSQATAHANPRPWAFAPAAADAISRSTAG